MATKDQPASKEANKVKLDVTILFIKRKETPGTFAYQQVDENGQEERTPVGTLYIKKDAMSKGVPDVLKVHIIGE